MKIDFVGSSLVGGGAERVMITLANTFVDKGHEVTIITFNPPDDFIPNEKVKRVKLHYGKFKNHTLRSFFALYRYYRSKKNRPDIMITFMASTNFITIPVAKLLGIKVIASEHTNHMSGTSKRVKITRKYLYKLVDMLTVLTSFDFPYYNKLTANVRIVPNPSSFTKYKNQTTKRDNVILTVGSLERYKEKGFENLLHIIEPVLKKNDSWILKIAGGGIKGEKILKELAQTLGISKQIVFTGFRDDIESIMRTSQIFVLPSISEGLPMVLIEAMSQGMACISYDCISGPSDIIEHEVNGLLIEDQNQKAMRQGLEKLIENKELRDTFSYNALLSVDRYNIDVIYSKWAGLFKELNLCQEN